MPSRRMLAAIIAVAVATVIAVIVLLVVGAPPAEAPGTDQGGPGLPVQLPGESYAGETVALEAPLVVGSEGCFRLGTQEGDRFVIWPDGFTTGGDAVVDADGVIIADGAVLSVEGVEMPYDALLAIEGPDGHWASVAGFCIGDDDRVLVLDAAQLLD
ncbi:hypothetical protein GCM10009792_14770 [Microcella alkalica]|uniref:Uncharacterized protein n=1 Tax=Microcella alkalica TaxID=355930 RepID=A0A839ECU8_9MICO|nr:hypothetical protein [Microcella alkalica]MBA8847155.1 hypothetical protein [Microcella alkalica]